MPFTFPGLQKRELILYNYRFELSLKRESLDKSCIQKPFVTPAKSNVMEMKWHILEKEMPNQVHKSSVQYFESKSKMADNGTILWQ